MALTLLGVTGAAVIVISPLAAWRAPVEIAGLAVIGLSAALIRASRPTVTPRGRDRHTRTDGNPMPPGSRRTVPLRR